MHPTGGEQSPESVLSTAGSRLGAKGAVRFPRMEQSSTKLCVYGCNRPRIHWETEGSQREREGWGMPGEIIHLSGSGHLPLLLFNWVKSKGCTWRQSC